jgi:hypothetical protein
MAASYTDDPAWDHLLDGGELDWNIGNPNWGIIHRGDRTYELACCMPLKPRLSPPRWPMCLEWSCGELCEGGIECVTDWMAIVRELKAP